jgi:hypothetical protein
MIIKRYSFEYSFSFVCRVLVRWMIVSSQMPQLSWITVLSVRWASCARSSSCCSLFLARYAEFTWCTSHILSVHLLYLTYTLSSLAVPHTYSPQFTCCTSHILSSIHLLYLTHTLFNPKHITPPMITARSVEVKHIFLYSGLLVSGLYLLPCVQNRIN